MTGKPVEGSKRSKRRAAVKAAAEAAGTQVPPPYPFGGRPRKLDPDEATFKRNAEIIVGLGRIMCTQEETASVVGVSLETLREFWLRYPEVKILWEDGGPFAKASLKRIQWKHAEESPHMAIFLGKNMLGQSDRVEHGGAGKDGAIPIDIRNLSHAQLAALLDRVTQLRRQRGTGGGGNAPN